MLKGAALMLLGVRGGWGLDFKRPGKKNAPKVSLPLSGFHPNARFTAQSVSCVPTCPLSST